MSLVALMISARQSSVLHKKDRAAQQAFVLYDPAGQAFYGTSQFNRKTCAIAFCTQVNGKGNQRFFGNLEFVEYS